MLKGTNAEISASTGGRLAGPIAKAMLDAALALDRRSRAPRTPSTGDAPCR
jgi:hypothetical protein